MISRCVWFLALLSVAGCAARAASSPPPSSMPAESSRSIGGAVSAQTQQTLSVVRETDGVPSGEDASLPSTPSATAPGRAPMPVLPTMSAGGMAPPPSAQPIDAPAVDEGTRTESQIAQWQAELDHQRRLLASTLSQCRDVCAAASNVCTAAREVCRLTGDLANTNARDARCTRARSACVDAGRRRDGACPVCPAR